MTDDEPLVSRAVIREHQIAQDRRWRSAVRAFDPAPDRLRELAAAANGQARVIRLAELGGMNWNPIEGASQLQLADGLDNPKVRQGPPALWKTYDKQLRALGVAMEGADSRKVADSWEALRDALSVIADALDPTGATAQPEKQAGTG
jgi:hypothetical protein